MEEQVVLVDPNNIVLGTMGKTEVHQKGVLHRAFSVFVFNKSGELMLQQRAADKYHSPLLWTNTCCSHPRLHESVVDAGQRRVREELGFDVVLREQTKFIYKSTFGNGLTEHELDAILVGYFDGEPHINTDEVADWKWMQLDDVRQDIKDNPSLYTDWFRIIFEKHNTFSN